MVAFTTLPERIARSSVSRRNPGSATRARRTAPAATGPASRRAARSRSAPRAAPPLEQELPRERRAVQLAQREDARHAEERLESRDSSSSSRRTVRGAARTARRRRGLRRASTCRRRSRRRARPARRRARASDGVLLGQHASTVGMGDQELVPAREETDRSALVAVRERRPRQVDQLATLLVGEAPQPDRLERGVERLQELAAPRREVGSRRRPERREVPLDEVHERVGDRRRAEGRALETARRG